MKAIGKICLCVVLSLLIIGTSACNKPPVVEESTGVKTSSTEEITEEPTKEGIPPVILEPRKEFAMEHTIKMLNEDKKLTVAYIGGSVTSGTGVEETEKYSWRALTTAWLKEQYPDANIKQVTASIGGTGSHLGVFRYDYEVIQEEPDLIFIEFAINDYYDGRTYEEAVSTMEGMVRKTLRARPCADIVIVLTTDNACLAREFDCMRAHMDVAKAYGIPYICVGQDLVNHIQKSKEPWEKYYSDSVHPNIAGYAYYASVVRTRLSALLNGTEKVTYQVPASPIGSIDYLNAGIILPKQVMKKATADGFIWQYKSFSWVGVRYNGAITGISSNATLTFSFTGTEFGLFYDTAKDAGIVSVVIDGTIQHTIDAYAENLFPYMQILAKNLPQGTHTVTIRITGKNPLSQASRFDIGAVLYR